MTAIISSALLSSSRSSSPLVFILATWPSWLWLVFVRLVRLPVVGRVGHIKFPTPSQAVGQSRHKSSNFEKLSFLGFLFFFFVIYSFPSPFSPPAFFF